MKMRQKIEPKFYYANMLLLNLTFLQDAAVVMAPGGTPDDQIEAAGGMCSACYVWPDKFEKMFKAAEYGHVICLKAAIEEGAATEEDRKNFVNALEQPKGRRKEILHQRSLGLHPSGSNAQHGALDTLYTEEALYPPQKTALVIAAERGHVECVELLIQSGACVSIDDTSGRTPLMAAAENGHDRCVELLIKEGIKFSLEKKDGEKIPYVDWPQENEEEDFFINLTALMYASKKGHTTCVNLLLKAGADVNLKDRDDMTALMYGATNGYDDCVELLLKAGADVNTKDRNDMTALALATSNGHAECAKLLQEAGASVNSDQLVFSDDENEDENQQETSKKEKEDRAKTRNDEEEDNKEENKGKMIRRNGGKEEDGGPEDENIDENNDEVTGRDEEENAEQDNSVNDNNGESKGRAATPRRITRSWMKKLEVEKEKKEKPSDKEGKEITEITRRITRSWKKIMDDGQKKRAETAKEDNIVETEEIVQIARMMTRALKRKMDDEQQREDKTSKEQNRANVKIRRMTTRSWKKRMEEERKAKRRLSERIRAIKRRREAMDDGNQDVKQMTKKARRGGSN